MWCSHISTPFILGSPNTETFPCCCLHEQILNVLLGSSGSTLARILGILSFKQSVALYFVSWNDLRITSFSCSCREISHSSNSRLLTCLTACILFTSSTISIVFFDSVTSRVNIPIDLCLLLLLKERRQGSVQNKLNLTPIDKKKRVGRRKGQTDWPLRLVSLQSNKRLFLLIEGRSGLLISLRELSFSYPTRFFAPQTNTLSLHLYVLYLNPIDRDALCLLAPIPCVHKHFLHIPFPLQLLLGSSYYFTHSCPAQSDRLYALNEW